MAPTMVREIDRGGTGFPPLPIYNSESFHNRNKTFILTFKIIETKNCLNSYSLILLNNALSKISSSWKYISSNRDRTVLTFEEPVEEISKIFLSTTELSLSRDITIKVKFELHNFMNKIKATVFSMELISLSDKEIIENLEDQGVIEVYRFKKRNIAGIEYPSGLFALTFDGNIRPKEIKIAYLKLEVKPSYQNPLQCKHCLRFGHNKANCKSLGKVQACLNCGSMDEHDECALYCTNCHGPHKPIDKKCPIFKQEKDIIVLKSDQNLSFPEARKRILERRGASSYAEAANRSELIKTVQSLKSEMEKISQTNKELTSTLKEQTSEIDKLRNEKKDSDSAEMKKQIQQIKEQMKVMETKHKVSIDELRSSYQTELVGVKKRFQLEEQNLLEKIKNLTATNQSLLAAVKLHKQSASASTSSQSSTPTPLIVQSAIEPPHQLVSSEDDSMDISEEVKGIRRNSKDRLIRAGNKKSRKNTGSTESNKL